MVMIYTKVVAIKNTSFHFRHEIVNDKDEVVAEAQDIIVLYDFIKKTKILIPEEIKSKIIDLEGSSFQASVRGD